MRIPKIPERLKRELAGKTRQQLIQSHYAIYMALRMVLDRHKEGMDALKQMVPKRRAAGKAVRQ